MPDSPRSKTYRLWMHIGSLQRLIPATQIQPTLWLASRRFFAWIRPGEAWPSGNARRRWDEILQRVLDAVAVCGTSPEIEKAKPLLKKRSISLEVSDQKMQTALSIDRKSVV